MLMFKMTRGQFETARTALKQKFDFNLVGDNGTIKAKGVVAQFHYSEPDLRLEVTSHPMFVTEHFTEDKMKEFLTPYTIATDKA